jgi:hypothetical protein
MHRSGIDPSAPDALARYARTPTVWEEAERGAEAPERPKQIYRPVPDERGGGLQSEERRVVVKRRHGADLEPCGAATVAVALAGRGFRIVITYNRIMTAGLVIWAACIFLLLCSLWSSVGAASVGVSPEGPGGVPNPRELRKTWYLITQTDFGQGALLTRFYGEYPSFEACLDELRQRTAPPGLSCVTRFDVSAGSST